MKTYIIYDGNEFGKIAVEIRKRRGSLWNVKRRRSKMKNKSKTERERDRERGGGDAEDC